MCSFIQYCIIYKVDVYIKQFFYFTYNSENTDRGMLDSERFHVEIWDNRSAKF